MGKKKNQTFFHGTYSNLASYIFLSNNVKVFQWLLKSKLLNFITKVNSNNRNETKSDIIHGAYLIWHHFSYVAKYWNISKTLLQKWTQTSKEH